MRIMIDPGHGGKDPGAVYQDAVEADLNALLAHEMTLMLEGMGHEVRLSRPLIQDAADYTPPWARAKLANALGADLFVSLHTNAFFTGGPRGVRFFVHRTNSPLVDRDSGEALAGALQTQAKKFLEPDMPVGRVGAMPKLTVLRRTAMPAVLVETGFITNSEDRSLLRDKSFRWRAAVAYAVGVSYWAERNLRGAA